MFPKNACLTACKSQDVSVMVSLGIYCEKIPTISLINIHHHTATLLFCHEHFTDLLSRQLSNIQHSIVHFSHHAVCYIIRTFIL